MNRMRRPSENSRGTQPPAGSLRQLAATLFSGKIILYGLSVLAFVSVLAVFVVQIVVSNKAETTIEAFQAFDNKIALMNRGNDVPLNQESDGGSDPADSGNALHAPLPSNFNVIDYTEFWTDTVRSNGNSESPGTEEDPPLPTIVGQGPASSTTTTKPTTKPTTSPSKTTADNTPYFVQKELVYIRIGPGQQYDVEGLGTLGLQLAMLERGANWSKVRTSTGITGYIRNDLFGSSKPDAPAPSAPAEGEYLYVNAKVVNLREAPSESAERVTYLCLDDRVFRISDQGSWSKIRLENGVVGFVRNDLLRKNPPEDSFEKMDRTLYVSADTANVRSSPSLNGPITGSVKRDESVYEIEANSTWSKVKLSNNKTGFIKSDSLTVVSPPPAGFKRVEKTVYINCGSANIRSNPTTDALIVAVAYEGTAIKTKAVGATWTMVVASNGEIGYIRSDLIRDTASVPTTTPTTTTKPSSHTSSKTSSGSQTTVKPTTAPATTSDGGSAAHGNPANNAVRAKLVEIAKSCVGVPYKSRVDAVTKNYMDCSGLVYYVYKVAGYNWTRYSANTMARTYGTRVSFKPNNYSTLLPGDLVFYSSDGGRTFNHVAVYIGGGQIVHATIPKARIQGIDRSVSADGYYRSPSLIKRIYD